MRYPFAGWMCGKILLTWLLLFSFTGLVCGESIVLKGQWTDFLVDVESGMCRTGTEEFSSGAENILPGWVVCVDRLLFVITRQGIVNVRTGETIPLPEQTLLPDVGSPVSGQWMVSGNTIHLPTSSGMQIINPVSGTAEKYRFSHHLKMEDGIHLDLARIVRSEEHLFLWQDGELDVYAGNGWEQLSRTAPAGVLEEQFLDSPSRAWLVRFRVDQGDLGSFRIEARPLNIQTAAWQNETVQEGLLRNLFVDERGRLVLEYMDASIMAAIFQAKKVKMRVVDPSKNLDTRQTFSVSHKRRHLFALSGPDGRIYVLIQCKDGNCYLTDPVSGQFSKLEKQFDYNFTFLRGESSGIFYQADTGAFYPVKLQLPSDR